MQFRLSTLLPVAALAAVVAAAPAELIARGGSNECTTGSIHCCNTTYQVGSPECSSIAGLLDIVLDGLTGVLGLGCSLNGDASSCTTQPVCCNNNNFSGGIVVACSPITINFL